MSHWQASTSSPRADNDDNNDDDDDHRLHARRHVLRRTQQQRQRHVHRDADDDDDDDDEAYGNDTFAYAVDDAYGDVDDDDDARDDDDAAYDNRTQRRVRRREHYPHHHNHHRRSSAASPHYVDAYYSGGGDSHRRRSPVYSTASHATSAAAAAAAVAGEDDVSDAGSGGGSSRSSTRPSRLRAFLTRLYSSSDEQRGLLTSSTARSAARASSTSRQQPHASQRQQQQPQQAYMTSGDGGGGYDTYDIYDPYDKDDGDDDDVDSRRRRRRVAAATRAATDDDDDAVHAEDDDDDDAVAAAATDNSGGGHRRRDADDDDDDDEAAVWREMRDVEEATQLWPRATGALHTTTVLQPHHLRRHSSGDTQSHAHRHSGGDKDDSSDHNRDSDKDKKDDDENDDDDASTHAHSQLGSGAEETLAQRMHYGVLADPRAQIVDMIVHSATGSVTVQHIRERFAWDDEYARMYGSVTEYLQSYQAIFVVSPVDDRVRLRRVRIDPAAIAAAAAATAARASSSSSTWHQHHHRDRSQLLLQQQAQHERGRRRLYTPPPPPSPRAHRRSSSRQQQQQQQRRSHSSNPRYRRSQRQQQQQQQQQRRRRQSSSRRGVRDRDDAAAVAAMNIGSVSSSCVADHFDLDELAIAYRRRGYDVVMVYDVLHVSSARVFDLFLFANGLVVWWGKDRSHHWMVEDDFLSSTSYVHSAVRQRYAQADIETLFPNWCSYAEDDAYGEADTSVSPFGYRHDVVDAALARFGTVLCFDHYLVPAAEPARSQVMLTLSYSLGRTARADYFEHITQSSHRHVLSIPSELHGVLDHFATRRRIVRLEGELQMALLGITSLKDTPDFLWEMPWLDGYYALAEEQNSSEQRLLWFSARSDALLEQLSNLKARRHVLFLLGSDVFLIVLLIIDVLCMTARLMVALYFGILRD